MTSSVKKEFFFLKLSQSATVFLLPIEVHTGYPNVRHDGLIYTKKKYPAIFNQKAWSVEDVLYGIHHFLAR